MGRDEARLREIIVIGNMADSPSLAQYQAVQERLSAKTSFTSFVVEKSVAGSDGKARYRKGTWKGFVGLEGDLLNIGSACDHDRNQLLLRPYESFRLPSLEREWLSSAAQSPTDSTNEYSSRSTESTDHGELY